MKTRTYRHLADRAGMLAQARIIGEPVSDVSLIETLHAIEDITRRRRCEPGVLALLMPVADRIETALGA